MLLLPLGLDKSSCHQLFGSGFLFWVFVYNAVLGVFFFCLVSVSLPHCAMGWSAIVACPGHTHLIYSKTGGGGGG